MKAAKVLTPEERVAEEKKKKIKKINAGLAALRPFLRAGMMDEGPGKEIADRLREIVGEDPNQKGGAA